MRFLLFSSAQFRLLAHSQDLPPFSAVLPAGQSRFFDRFHPIPAPAASGLKRPHSVKHNDGQENEAEHRCYDVSPYRPEMVKMPFLFIPNELPWHIITVDHSKK
jgi:hypothetical protein